MTKNPNRKQREGSKAQPTLLEKEFALLNSAMREGFHFLKDDLSDAEVVLLSTSLLDEYLKFSLILRFRIEKLSRALIADVFEGHGPLATFSAKITTCAAFGVLHADERHDLAIIRKIRNDFAHSPKQIFLKDMKQCNSLTLKSDKPIIDDTPERLKYKQSCAALIGRLAVYGAISLSEAVLIHHSTEQLKTLSQDLISGLYENPPKAAR